VGEYIKLAPPLAECLDLPVVMVADKVGRELLNECGINCSLVGTWLLGIYI